MTERNDDIGITKITGHKLAPSDAVNLDKRELQALNRSSKSADIALALQTVENQSFGTFHLDSNTVAYATDKTRPYSAMFDTMVIVGDPVPSRRFIESINDLTPLQLQRLLGLSEQVLEIYNKQEDPRNPIEVAAVAYNSHRDPLPDNAIPGVKTRVKSLDPLHFHITAFQKNELSNMPNSITQLGKTVHDNIFDPFIRLYHRWMDIGSVRNSVSPGVMQALELDETNYPTGIRFKHPDSTINNRSLALDLQTLHSTMETQYYELANVFLDFTQEDSIGMPRLHSKKTIRGNIDHYINTLRRIPGNRGRSTQDTIDQFSYYLHELAPLLQPGERAAQSPAARHFLRGFAYTTTLVKDMDRLGWDVIFAPRFISTGNMIASLGMYRETPDTPPPKSWYTTRNRTIGEISKLSKRWK